MVESATGRSLYQSYTLENRLPDYIPDSRVDNQDRLLVATDKDMEQYPGHVISRLTFAYPLPDYPSEDILYKTRIVGDDAEWSKPTSTPEFTQLLFRPGEYTFEVRASRNSIDWTEPLRIDFVIRRPWWMSNTMYGVYALLILGAFAGYVNWRSGKLRHRNKILIYNIRKRTRHLTDTIHKYEREIQERRRIEQQLKESNFTKEQLIKILSHDLRSPFQGIVGFASMLREQDQAFKKEERDEIIDHIISSTESAVSLLNQMLKWTNLQSGKIPFDPDWLNLKVVVRNVTGLLGSMAGSKRIKINVEIPDDLKIYADEGMLQTILRNLFSNAVKFTEENGEVTISAIANDDTVEIKLSDTGVGMDQHKLVRILDKEEVESTRGTGKERGSGLGLVMCKGMVERHGGKLTGVSSKGKGTTFFITLPLPS